MSLPIGHKPASALVFDGAGAEAALIRRALRSEFELFVAGSPDDARAILADQDVALAFVVATGDGGPARDLLAEMARRWPETVRIAVTPADDRSVFACEAAGAQDIVALPLIETAARVAARHARALFRLRRAHEQHRIELKLRDPRPVRRVTVSERNAAFDRIVRAPGSPMGPVCEQAARIASFDVPALILGETGCGKELLARAIHGVSLRSDRPFHAVNCGAIPDELLESELFGHRKGAFTGAHANRTGLLQQADRGTIFLDEVADTSPAFQVKLLRFLQEGEIRPVGGDETLKVDVRVIAACNRDLEAEVAAGRFRADLYYRLAVAPIRVPPLRERRADIPLLIERLLDRAMAQHGKTVAGVTREAACYLSGWSWPGNIRELENELLRMLMMAPGDRIGPELLSPRILRAAPPAAAPDPCADAAVTGSGCLKDRVERMEARILRETLVRHGWNKSRAAEELGLSRVGLRAKLDRYGLDRDAPFGAAAE